MNIGTILALDFSWRNTGWVLIDPEGKPLKWGVISTKPRKKEKEDKNHLQDIAHELQNYDIINIEINNILGSTMEELNIRYENIKTIAEVPYFSQHSKAAIYIGMSWSLLHKLKAEFILGSEVKEILTGNPRAKKTEISQYIIEHGGLKLMMEKDHIKDAYATYLAWKTKQYKLSRQLSRQL